MDENSSNPSPNLPEAAPEKSILPGWTENEMTLLERAEKYGVRPISPTLASQMFSLFLEGYTCHQIAAQVKTLNESEILHCRKKFNWDVQKDEYTAHLTVQVREKLQRQKMESVEFLTNMLSVTHKHNREKMLKYIQTGDKADLPDFQVTTIKGYKEIIETIGKITGEDKVQKHTFSGAVDFNTNASNGSQPQERQVGPGASAEASSMTKDLQSKILRALASGVKAGSSE